MGILDAWNTKDDANEGLLKKTIIKAIETKAMVRIQYRKYDGESSFRTLSNLIYNNNFEEDGFHDDHISAYCHLRKEDRTFKINRIVSAEIIHIED